MRQRTLVQVVAAVVVIVFAVGIWSTGGHVDLGWLRYFSAAVFLATALLLLWDRVIWKLSPIQRMRGAPRDLSGTWKGTLTSFWEDPSTGKPPTPKPAYLVVRQTASAVSAILLTDESRSVSSLGTVGGGDGLASLDYMYLNRPDSRVENRSRMHHGSTSLDITGIPATRLKGRYWTDRDSKGELEFVEHRQRAAEDYEEASRLFGSKGDIDV
jgi:hypothetical protein